MFRLAHAYVVQVGLPNNHDFMKNAWTYHYKTLSAEAFSWSWKAKVAGQTRVSLGFAI